MSKSRPHRYRPPRATMLQRVGGLVRLIFWWFFAKVTFAPRLVDTILEAHSRGPVVYVMHRRGIFDFLYFNYAFLKNKLPIAQWSNGRSTVWLRPFFGMLGLLFKRRDRRGPLRQFEDVLRSDGSALLFLHRGRPGQLSDTDAFSQPYLEHLLELQNEHDRPIQLVPMMVIWERRSEDFHPTLVDEVFGPRQSPGFLRKLFHVIKNLWQPFFKMGEPLVQVAQPMSVNAFCESGCDSASERVQRSLEMRVALEALFEAERSVVLGPRAKNAHAIKTELIVDEVFREGVRGVLEAKLESPPSDEVFEEALTQARKNLDSIAADPSMLTIKILGALLTPVWSMIYDGLEVDEEGLERVREASREGRLVLIPSHKSHIDYLILSYVFFQSGLMPPHIAAGDNLNFPPIGSIFRRAGAFFLRRSFRDDPLYAYTLRSYIGKLLREGYPVEFFIEGGRSRTGKLLTPRFGMLRMIIDSHLESPIENLKIVPCSVTYERIVEASSYQRELEGAKKKKENLGALLRSTQVLTSRFGRLHVTFGEPLDVGEYMERYAVTPEASSSDDVARLTQRLGYRVIYEINKASIVAPSALTALVALNARARGLGSERLQRDVGFLLHLLLRKGIRLSPPLRTALGAKRAQLKRNELAARVEGLEDFEHDFLEQQRDHPLLRPQNTYLMLGKAVGELIDEAVRLFSEGNLIEMTTLKTAGRNDPNRFFYSVPEDARVELSYYKNNILHAFVPEALLAIALLEPRAPEMALEPLMDRTLFLSKLFKYEFFYEERAAFQNVFWRTFDDFEQHGWVRASARSGPKARVELPESPPQTLEYFRDLVLTFLEAYTLVASELVDLEQWMDEADFLDHLTFRCRILYHEGGLRFLETLARPTFKNALKRFEEWDILETRHVGKRKPVKQLRLLDATLASGAHRDLHTRLEALLRGRKEEPPASESPRKISASELATV